MTVLSVFNKEHLAWDILGHWFKHEKFVSFVQQLNFHKIPHLFFFFSI
jgi:HSF-type DNA-binding